jgi:hypothetical protein
VIGKETSQHWYVLTYMRAVRKYSVVLTIESIEGWRCYYYLLGLGLGLELGRLEVFLLFVVRLLSIYCMCLCPFQD